MNDSRKREQRAWYIYDWANSAFPTTVVTLFFGPYLTILARESADTAGQVHLLGMSIAHQAVWPYLVSLSVFTQVLALPLVGAIADYGSLKKPLLGVTAYTGAATTVAMFVLVGGQWLLGCLLFLIANFAYGASIVLYNAFLPEIASPGERDAVSSNGWGLGYVGGGLLLALNLLLYSNAASLGISETLAVRISLASAGLWWALFTIVPLLGLRGTASGKSIPPGQGYFLTGLRQLTGTLRKARALPQTLLFLIAFLIYNDGIQTVLTLAAQFGQEELGLPMSVLTASILLSQFVAFFGAIGFKYVAAWVGNKQAVMAALAVWTLTLLYVYFGVRGERDFYLLAAIVGLVMGGSQALSRSIYSFLIPKGQEAEYFSLYEVSDKGTSWLGPLILARVLELTGSFRKGVLSIAAFFLIGLVILARVNVRDGAQQAGNAPPPAG